jgi:hypothetical protein
MAAAFMDTADFVVCEAYYYIIIVIVIIIIIQFFIIELLLLLLSYPARLCRSCGRGKFSCKHI